MNPRTTRSTVSFGHPFSMGGGGPWPPGLYEVEVDEEPVGTGIGHPAWRRVATIIHVPGERPGERQALRVEPTDLAGALAADVAASAAAPPPPGVIPPPPSPPEAIAPTPPAADARPWLTPPVLVPLAVAAGALLSGIFGPFG